MTKPILGKSDAGDIAIDVRKLLASRLLLEADSGGGKTVALKRILEQTHGHVQQIIIDPEGEFSTLREKFDYLLCAPEGADAIANPKTAAILARKLRETRVSAVLDIFDLRPQDQKHFVRLFVDELMAAPKKLWNPCLVIIDEAQIFAPENDKAESIGAIMDLRGRGRKRGLCPILATPRLAQLSKDACAGLQNKLIGITTLDLDVKRAARDLSMSHLEATELLRNLEPGEFYCFGPALTRKITKVKIGPIQTSHGQHTVGKDTRPPAPSEKIKQVLAKLADLPKEAEQEATTLAELKAENTRLKHELTAAKKAQPAPEEKAALAANVSLVASLKNQIKAAHQLTQESGKIIERATALLNEARELTVPVDGKDAATTFKPSTIQINRLEPSYPSVANTQSVSLPSGERTSLTAIAQYPDGVTRQQLTILTGYKRSTRDAYIQRLSNRGFVTINGDRVLATAAGVHALGNNYQPLPVGDALREHWYTRLPDGELKILQYLCARYPHAVPREDIDQHVNYARSSRDAYIQRLAAKNLLTLVGRGEVKASQELFG